MFFIYKLIFRDGTSNDDKILKQAIQLNLGKNFTIIGAKDWDSINELLPIEQHHDKPLVLHDDKYLILKMNEKFLQDLKDSVNVHIQLSVGYDTLFYCDVMKEENVCHLSANLKSGTSSMIFNRFRK